MDKKDFVEDGLSTNEIREKIKSIRQYLKNPNNNTLEQKIEYLKLTESFFVERYPFLFDMCIKDDFNYETLNYFLDMRDNIINNKMSSEEASKKVGQEWFDKNIDVSKIKKNKK
jgi:hypothetical protein